MKTSLPPHLSLELTRRCNYRCPFCYCVWHESPHAVKRELSTAEWEEIILSSLERGVKELLFTGGEALLRHDMLELAAYARNLAPKAELSLFTNGALVTDSLLEELFGLKVRLAVSLPGLRTYGEMTGTRRECFPVLELLMRARELGHPADASLTISSLNYSEAEDMFCAAADSGAAQIQMGPVMFEGRARTAPELTISRGDWEALRQRIRSLPDQGVPYAFCDEMICGCRTGNTKEHLVRFGNPAPVPCRAGLDFGTVGPDGMFRKCLHDPAGVPFRTLTEESLPEVF